MRDGEAHSFKRCKTSHGCIRKALLAVDICRECFDPVARSNGNTVGERNDPTLTSSKKERGKLLYSRPFFFDIRNSLL